MKDPVKYEIRIQRVFLVDRFEASDDKRNRFVLDPGVGEKRSWLCVAKVHILSRKLFSRSIESQYYVFSPHIEVTRLIDMVD